MSRRSKKAKKKDAEDDVEEAEGEEVEEEIQKTSIQISTKVRDRLWRLKFRKTYDEFLWELCEIYEKSVGEE